ncbi:hypothetical protein PFISCL1PPCAC_14397, partial [Pristionchus fissidentatus]
MIMGDYYKVDGSLRIQQIVGTAINCFIMAICFSFMIYAIFTIYVYLRQTKLFSQTAIRLQRQLFFTLCLQTLIPFFSMYVSCGLTITFPIFRIDDHWMADNSPLFISFFLPLDALAVLLTMSDYKREIARIFNR